MYKGMRVLVLAFVAAGASLTAHTADTVILRATLSPANETPPVTGVEASGTATIRVHLSRAGDGTADDAAVDFDISYNIAGATEITGLHIHEGPAGLAGGVVIGSGISAANAVSHAGGAGTIFRQVATTDKGLLSRILARPDQFYVNLHTSVNAAGLMRGQMAKAELLVLRASLSPLNEVPPIPDLDASASANIMALAVRDASGQIVSGAVTFDVNHRFAQTADIVGMHIHNAEAGRNAGVVIGTDLSARSPITTSGPGNINRTVEITGGAALDALRGLFVNPPGYYVNQHTSKNAAGAIRGQLQFTGKISLDTEMFANNEAPPVSGQPGYALGKLTAYVTRNRAGQITSGTVIFDVTHLAFPGNAEFTGLHIHKAPAGTSGGVVISSGLSATASATSPASEGNIYRVLNIDAGNPTALAALNGLLANPDQFYMNLHTSVFASGAARGQMGTAPAGPPQINANGIISAVQDASIAAASPGALISIYGTNLANIASDSSGTEAGFLPIAINGTEVRIGARQAPLLYVSPTQINAQAPFETDTGNVQVFVVRSGNYGPAVMLAVSQASPAIFVIPGVGAAVLKNADFSLVSASNPAVAGDVLLVFATGLGTVRPQIESGRLAPLDQVSVTNAQPKVTIGGQAAEVVGSALTPGFTGLYQVAVRMPAGVGAGSQPVVVTVGEVRSNAATMAAR